MKAYLLSNKVWDQRKIVTVEDILSKDFEGEEGYSSLFAFEESEITFHKSEHKTFAAYAGKVYGKWIVLDIDSSEPLESLTRKIVPLLDDLELFGVPYHLFFSGNKGFHLYMHKKWFLYPEDLDGRFNEVSRIFAHHIAKTYDLEHEIDLSIYDKVRIFRIPYSVHPVTNNQKIKLIYHSESDKPEEILRYQ